MDYFDENGVIVTGVLPPEEAKALKDQVDLAAKEMSEIKDKLGKLENKDYNFKKLREMTEEEKKNLSVREMDLIKRQEKLEEDTGTFKTGVVESHKTDALAVLVGDDKDLREKVLFHYGRIKDEAVSKDDVNKKMKEAYLLATGKAVEANPLRMAHNFEGQAVIQRSETLTDEQRDLAKKLGIKDEELKKYAK